MHFGANASAVASRRYLFPFILSVPIAASRCMPDAQAKRKKNGKISSQLFEHAVDKNILENQNRKIQRKWVKYRHPRC